MKPKVGDVVRSKTIANNPAGYIVGKEGIHVWVRFFDDDKLEDGDRWDTYTRRDTLEIISRGKN
jgi:hypothetical protein|tara:strand:+ start:376 stop:567 length:192 start_codon:yes stop_codon:yes gene_type:complete